MPPAATLLVGWLLCLGVLDLAVRELTGDTFTAVAQRHPVFTVVFFVLLLAHLADLLGPLDPFYAIAGAVHWLRTGHFA